MDDGALTVFWRLLTFFEKFIVFNRLYRRCCCFVLALFYRLFFMGSFLRALFYGLLFMGTFLQALFYELLFMGSFLRALLHWLSCAALAQLFWLCRISPFACALLCRLFFGTLAAL